MILGYPPFLETPRFLMWFYGGFKRLVKHHDSALRTRYNPPGDPHFVKQITLIPGVTSQRWRYFTMLPASSKLWPAMPGPLFEYAHLVSTDAPRRWLEAESVSRGVFLVVHNAWRFSVASWGVALNHPFK